MVFGFFLPIRQHGKMIVTWDLRTNACLIKGIAIYHMVGVKTILFLSTQVPRYLPRYLNGFSDQVVTYRGWSINWTGKPLFFLLPSYHHQGNRQVYTQVGTYKYKKIKNPLISRQVNRYRRQVGRQVSTDLGLGGINTLALPQIKLPNIFKNETYLSVFYCPVNLNFFLYYLLQVQDLLTYLTSSHHQMDKKNSSI